MNVKKSIKIDLKNIRKLNIKEGEVLLIKESEQFDFYSTRALNQKLNCLIMFVKSFDNFMIISNKKLKKKNECK